MEKPWVEKYRPKRLDEIVGQEEIVKRLKKYVEKRSMPHLLFSGPPGVGKTTAALCLARELYGENWRENFLELNASVAKDTPILVKINGVIKRTTFEELDKLYFNSENIEKLFDGEYVETKNLEVLTVENNKVVWKPVKYLIRHKVNKILEVRFEGGKIKLTGNHSVMVFNENGELTTKHAKDLKVGDCIISFVSSLKDKRYELTSMLYAAKGFKNKIRYPNIIKLVYLKGLADVNSCENWDGVVRLSSKDLSVDIVWLSRILGIESSIFKGEVRLMWKKHKNSDLLPAKMFIKFFEKISDKIKINWRCILRHQLYGNKNMVSKNKVIAILNNIKVDELTEDERKIYKNLRNIALSDLHVVKIKEIKLLDYNDYVYDVSVPNNEMFFAGEVPILLHNSDERGIDVIRTKVKEFARTKPIADAPFKIVFLDESDALTADAQNALRRTMEKYSDVCRFILSCNYPSKIIPPIQSRCAVFRFSPLKKEEIAKKLKEIAEKEGLKLEPSGLEAIIYVSEGDMRKAINILQTAAALDNVITDELVYKVSSRARPEEVKEMMNLALEGNFEKARDLLYKLMVEWGMSGEDILNQMFREINNLNIPEKKKVELAEAIGETDFRIVEGANERIQLSALLAKMALLGKRL
ncbi:replication factor C [Methanocaldococcus villosus KIN24-T80]|uniref:Replication factor C small subunit n=1 Tax=Methanocaldococcus villosus KIN24-T80 TaxID=1069083 RepID=N6VT50_9EURY|nr:replication factor C [Methanocaldococcus villosus KIN24-T80]